MDLQNFNNNPQFSDCPSSPVYTQTTSYILNTPKTNKSIYDSKSPLRRLKLKKSKRRECTPAYSPKFYDEQDEKNIFHQHANTDIKKRDKIFFKDQGENKENEYRINQRLSFDDVNVKNLFPQNNTLKNFSEQTHSKKFITLIEESLNDVNDNYYGILCSQITPDTIFKTIFTNGSEEEKAKKQYQNLFLNEEEDIQGGINAYSAVQKILINLKNKNFDQLVNMVIKIYLI